MLARRTTTVLVGLTVFTNAFQLPRQALRPTRRRAADDDDDFDFEAASKQCMHQMASTPSTRLTGRFVHRFKARVEEVDVVEAVFGDEGRLWISRRFEAASESF